MPLRGVSTRLSTVMLSMAAFQYSLESELNHKEMEAVIVHGSLAVLALAISASAQQNVGAPSLVDAISLLLIGASLAPVFGTLTSSYATNTVEIMTNITYLIHLYSMDNRIEIAHAWASPVSLNAAFASALLQASRLRSSALSFTFTILCTALLVFVPAADLPPMVDFLLAAAACTCSFIWFGIRRALLFIAVFVFVAVLGPRMLNKIRSVKMNGPWDLLHVPEDEDY
jgi:Phosphatidylinositol N-acetylglucosaminyltransferase